MEATILQHSLEMQLSNQYIYSANMQYLSSAQVQKHGENKTVLKGESNSLKCSLLVRNHQQ